MIYGDSLMYFQLKDNLLVSSRLVFSLLFFSSSPFLFLSLYSTVPHSQNINTNTTANLELQPTQPSDILSHSRPSSDIARSDNPTKSAIPEPQFHFFSPGQQSNPLDAPEIRFHNSGHGHCIGGNHC